jgi:hypothetical protein
MALENGPVGYQPGEYSANGAHTASHLKDCVLERQPRREPPVAGDIGLIVMICSYLGCCTCEIPLWSEESQASATSRDGSPVAGEYDLPLVGAAGVPYRQCHAIKMDGMDERAGELWVDVEGFMCFVGSLLCRLKGSRGGCRWTSSASLAVGLGLEGSACANRPKARNILCICHLNPQFRSCCQIRSKALVNPFQAQLHSHYIKYLAVQ